ncbi:hypothetical protein GCM10017711_01300 [Paeniglutamicibacter sulfureus]
MRRRLVPLPGAGVAAPSDAGGVELFSIMSFNALLAVGNPTANNLKPSICEAGGEAD